MNKQDFILKIKTKYPDYADVNDDELFNKIMAKYPEYKQQVTVEPKQSKTQPEDIALNVGEFVGGFTPASPLIMGVGETVRGLQHGSDLPTSLRKGAVAAGTDAALMFTGQKLTKGAGNVARFLLKGKIPKEAIVRAVERPQILEGQVKSAVDVGGDILSALRGLKQKSSDAFESGIALAQAKAAGKMLPMQGVKAAITKSKYAPEFLKADLMKAAADAKLSIPEELIERFVGGTKGNLTFDEARTMNSLLASLTDYRSPSFLGEGLMGKISSIKKPVLKQMEKASPGVLALNKQYAMDTKLSKNIVKAIGSEPDKLKEGALKALGLQLSGLEKNKTVQAKQLQALEQRSGFKFIDSLKDSVAYDAINKGSKGGVPSVILGALAGGGAGLLGGGPLGGGAGLIAGGLASQIPGNPDIVKAGLRYGGAIPQALRLGTTPIRTWLDQQAAGAVQ